MRYTNTNPLIAWLPFALTLTLVAFFVYGAAQMIVRFDANDPQVQVAEDSAEALASGMAPEQIVAQLPVISLEKSLDVFIAVYDKAGKLMVTSARIGTTPPSIPLGVLETTKAKGEYRVTWEPKPGVREAVVAHYYSGTVTGFVVVGRSLREAEQLESNLFRAVGIGWLISLFATFLCILFVRRFSRVREETGRTLVR